MAWPGKLFLKPFAPSLPTEPRASFMLHGGLWGRMVTNVVEETTFSFSTRAPQPPERRRDTRHITILRVGTILVDGRRELCLIRNISAGGLMAHVYSQL